MQTNHNGTIKISSSNNGDSLDDNNTFFSTNISDKGSLRHASIITGKVWERSLAILDTSNHFAN